MLTTMLDQIRPEHLEYIALAVGVIASVHMILRVYWNHRAQQRLERVLAQERHAMRLMAEVQEILDSRKTTDAGAQDEPADRSSADEELVVTAEELYAVLKEMEDAAKELESREQAYVLGALQQDSREGRVRYALKMLRRSGIVNGINIQLRPPRSRFA